MKAEIRKKHIRNFDDQFWNPAKVSSHHSVLELGCGVGLFLAYLQAKGITDFVGIDNDPNVTGYMPPEISEKVINGDIWSEIEKLGRRFDRIVLLDVFEHFSFVEGQQLLLLLKEKLTLDGKIILRVPNAASPFGLQYQFGDVTHKAAYGPGALQHVALAGVFEVDKILSVKKGSRFKQISETLIFALLNRILTDPPPLWSANMIAVLAPAKS